jgi:hypothetical protein
MWKEGTGSMSIATEQKLSSVAAGFAGSICIAIATNHVFLFAGVFLLYIASMVGIEGSLRTIQNNT